MVAIIVSSMSLALSLVSIFFIVRLVKSMTTIIGPRIDLQDKKFQDLIKKLQKIL